jgi:tRNA-splicing ligase RtcB
MHDKRLLRIDPTQLTLRTDPGFPVRIFANKDVAIEAAAVGELLSVLGSQSTFDRFEQKPQIEAVAVTPDFHKGAGIPIGTVIKTKGAILPQAIGNDVNCGMRLHTTDLAAEDMSERLDAFESAARRLYFEGARQIPMESRDRESLLQGGLKDLFANAPWDRMDGQWQTLAQQGWHQSLDHVERSGSLPSRSTSAAFTSWMQSSPRKGTSHDDQIGSIGGGNHFVEIQRVERILDRRTAFAWGLKQGSVTIMVHSGSVGIGHTAGRFIRELTRAAYPAKLPHPANGNYPIIEDDIEATEFWDLLHNAANFAFANRLFLATSAVEAVEKSIGESVQAPLLYDSPHNLVWRTSDGGYLHRKGATPARGMDDMEGGPFHSWGEPVLVPGSMGASSFVLAGMGKPAALDSASHGAGRALSRGTASRSAHKEFDEFLRKFRIVTPLDLRRGQRSEIVRRKVEELRAEGPHAYKGIRAIIETLESAGIAKPVAELVPLATVKG